MLGRDLQDESFQGANIYYLIGGLAVAAIVLFIAMLPILEKIQNRSDDSFAQEELGRLYAEVGRVAEAEAALKNLQRASASRFVDTAALSSQIFIGLGRNDDALTSLEKSLEVHSTALTSLKVNPIYDPLRSNPRFSALMRKVHLSE